MAIEYASKYAPQVDERFKLGSLTGGIVNNAFDFIGVSTVKVYSIPTVPMGDYTISGTSRYGNPEELGNEAQELKVSQDRAFTFTIDRKSHDDTMMTMEAGKALRRQIDEVVIPEVDTYRISSIVANAPESHVKDDVAITKDNAYEEFLAVQEILDNDKAPQGGRICLASAGYYKNIKLDDAFTKRGDMATEIAINGVVGEIDGVPVVKVPGSYLPEGVDFIITNPIVSPAPTKLAEYKIHDNAPGISGWLVEGRVRYDCFVLKEKANAIGVHKSPAV